MIPLGYVEYQLVFRHGSDGGDLYAHTQPFYDISELPKLITEDKIILMKNLYGATEVHVMDVMYLDGEDHGFFMRRPM